MADRKRPEGVLLSWSGGKDSALALARLLAAEIPVVGLVTTVTAGYDRISIHGVRRTLLRRQADKLQLDVVEVVIEPASSNQAYEAAWRETLRHLPPAMARASHIASGDIFLEDVRRYREELMRSCGFETVFPLWGEPTRELATEMLQAGITARVVCVDTHALAMDYVGRPYDTAFLESLPSTIDPCGERGEFHTFVSAGPGFSGTVPYSVGEVVLRDERFAYCDLLPETQTDAQ